MSEGRKLTLGEVANRFGIQAWILDTAFKRGLLPEPERVGRFRVIPEGELEKVRQVLVDAGYVKAEAPAAG